MSDWERLTETITFRLKPSTRKKAEEIATIKDTAITRLIREIVESSIEELYEYEKSK